MGLPAYETQWGHGLRSARANEVTNDRAAAAVEKRLAGLPVAHPYLIARDRSALCGKIRKQVAARGSRLKQTGGLVRATRHLRAADVVECEVGKIGVPIQSVASEPGGALQQGGPCHAEPP
jgi:hypothetical protein